MLTRSSVGNWDKATSKDAASALCFLVLLKFLMLCPRSSMVIPVVVFSRASTLNSVSEELAVEYRLFLTIA